MKSPQAGDFSTTQAPLAEREPNTSEHPGIGVNQAPLFLEQHQVIVFAGEIPGASTRSRPLIPR